MTIFCNSVRVRLLLLLSSAIVISCESVWHGPPRRIDFASVKHADQVRVCGRYCDEAEQRALNDPEQIRAAATFIEAYPDGWRDSWNGPAGGTVNLFFYQGRHLLGGYGVTPIDETDALVTVGGGSRRVSAREVVKLMGRLNLQWPPHQ
jgi:hypothetical protein